MERFLSSATGERMPEALSRLIASTGAEEYRQEPPLLITDGSTTVKIVFKRAAISGDIPHFVIKGAQFSGFSWLQSGELAVDLLPNRGALKASITIIASDEQVEYPLAIAPSLELFDAAAAGADMTTFVRVANELVRSVALK
jgi:hypothetical protein